jgi:Tol biopolymer transport system component
MGEVYRARDTRLDRVVAIKILPETLAADPQFRNRFDREARTISQLEHPHICALYDVGEQDGTSFLVMQYLEGETLEARLKKGAFPLDQALAIAIQIASALDTAHRAGIVHRDLKPGNIMLTNTGAKLLDFGLAKAGEAAAAGAGLSMLPTTPPGLTVQGTILGTFQYMAPEQLEGQEADARTDIFAFGAFLYEMLTGKKAFVGKSQASLIGAILKDDPPPISTLQPVAPALLNRTVTRCLAKEPDARWQSARDLLEELKWIAERSPATLPVAVAERWKMRERLAWIVAAACALAAVGFLIFAFRREPAAAQAVQFVVLPPEKGNFSDDGQAGTNPQPQLAISPDGRLLAFVVTTADGRARLWVRSLDAVAPRMLPGTEGAAHPFWSPDSRFIGFFAAASLKKIDVNGGPAQVLCDSPGTRGGTWNRDGVIVFARFWTDGLYRVSATGGTPVLVTKIDPTRHELWHRWPEFLPDGRHFLFMSRSTQPGQDGIYAGSLDWPETSRVLATDSRVAFAPPGYLLFVREGTLLAQSFNADTLRLIGDAVPAAAKVGAYPVTGEAAFSSSATGLAYASGVAIPASQLTWFDRSGRTFGTIGATGPNRNAALSRDGTRVAVQREDLDSGGNDLWVVDVAGGSTSRFTFGSAQKRSPVWSPDGNRIAFGSYVGTTDLYQKNTNGAGGEELLLKTGATGALATDWSSDGRVLVYDAAGPKTSYDLWILPLVGDRTPHPFLQTGFVETQGQLSPDGRWMAYSSDETGVREVWVQPVPASGAKWQLSTEGGAEPRWRRDGSELFYVAGTGMLMAVPIKAGAPTLEAGPPKPLFETHRPYTGPLFSNYVPAADGQRFLVNTTAADTPPSPITVVLNWTAALKK